MSDLSTIFDTLHRDIKSRVAGDVAAALFASLPEVVERAVAAALVEHSGAVVEAVEAELLRQMGEPSDGLGDRLIGEDDVRTLLGASPSGFDRLRRDPRKGFPKPNNRVDSKPRWFLSEVRAWMKTKG